MTKRLIGAASSSKDLNTSLSDVSCPICLEVLIEPVRMPCKHEICLECFNTMLDKTNLQCPMCRMRISTWARTATNNNTLVDQDRWKFIQTHFATEIRNRREGKTAADLMETVSHMVPAVKAVLAESKKMNANIEKPGEIAREYQEYIRLENERLQREKENEEQLSLAYIKHLIEREQAITINDYIQIEASAVGAVANSRAHSSTANTTAPIVAAAPLPLPPPRVNVSTNTPVVAAVAAPLPLPPPRVNVSANTPVVGTAVALNANVSVNGGQQSDAVHLRTVTRSASRVNHGRRPKIHSNVTPQIQQQNEDKNDSVFEVSPVVGASGGGGSRVRNAPVNRLHQRVLADGAGAGSGSGSEEGEGVTRRVTRSQSLRQQVRPVLASASATAAHDTSSTTTNRRRRVADESTATIHELETSTNTRSKKVKK